jgi:succinate-semialdehyde dehydrogenase/glutarate-semialdehyde dehydrogenase
MSLSSTSEQSKILSLLSDKQLFCSQCFIDGQWVEANDKAEMSVSNPATDEILGTVPKMSESETAFAISSADKALSAWRAKPAKERGIILNKWSLLMMEHQEDLAHIMTAEQGKPLAESRGEIAYAASFLEWFAEEGKRTYGDIIPSTQENRRVLVLKEPIGVCAAITPWNFPSGMITRKAAPALAAGCTIVLKPASATPFSALALAKLAERAGVPQGVFNVITGDSRVIGKELTGNPVVRKLTFTGSTEIGKELMRQCAGTVKKVSLELGGHAPFIVFEDADIDAAVEGAMQSKYRNAGQTCVCANRILVHESVHELFAAKFTERVKSLSVGNGMDAGVTVGPLIDESAVVKIEDQISDAVNKGASILIGGKRHQRGNLYFEPTVLTDVDASMKITREETFGPVAPIYSFKTDEEAINMANDTEYGLAAYFYSRDMSRIWRVSEALEYGIIGVNTGMVSTENVPFGGVKESGIGREGGKYGIEEFLEIKYVCLDEI